MPDLKHLLCPLEDRPMPDRWDEIKRRPVEPLAEPRRPHRLMAFVAAAAAALLVVAVIASLGPLSGGRVAPGPATSTPSATDPVAPTPAAAGLPTEDSVVDGRFVAPVMLDGGNLQVNPAPSDMQPPMPQADVEDELWASPTFSGAYSGKVLGFGLVTLTLSQHGIDSVTAVPAWVAFAWGGVHSCPVATAGWRPEDLPSNGYRAVVIGSSADLQPFAYVAASDPCDTGRVSDPTVEPATHVESVAWEQVGPIEGGTITVRYMPTQCGSDFGMSGGGSSDTQTIAVYVEVPDAALSCPSPLPTITPFDLHVNPTTIVHAPLGLVRQIQS